MSREKSGEHYLQSRLITGYGKEGLHLAPEIFNPTWDRVNMKEGFSILESGDTKTGEPRHVCFNGSVREILERLGKVRHLSHNQVFAYQGKPLKTIKTVLANGLEKTGIEDFRFHGLRHTWITNPRKGVWIEFLAQLAKSPCFQGNYLIFFKYSYFSIFASGPERSFQARFFPRSGKEGGK